MPHYDDILNEVHRVLEEKGMGEFQVKELELIPEHHPRRSVAAQPVSSDILTVVQDHLLNTGKGGFHVMKLDLALRLTGPACREGEIPKHVREEMPDGTVKWSIKCVKANP